MAVVPRYLVETAGCDNIVPAFRSIPALCVKHGISCVILVVPNKGRWLHSEVATFLGQAIAKALLKGETAWQGLTLSLQSPATFSSNVALRLVVGAHISGQDMSKIDDAIDAKAILYMPWNEAEGRAWQATWRPETIGPSNWGAPSTTLPDEVEVALAQLTQHINLGTGLHHPSDKAHAERVIAGLRANGLSFDPAAIKSWALRHGWSSNAAASLEKIAKKGE
jgi:hypothetical protein